MISELFLQLSRSPDAVIFSLPERDILAAEFMQTVELIKRYLQQSTAKRWWVSDTDKYTFSVGLFAVLAAGAEPVLLPDALPKTQALLRDAFDDRLNVSAIDTSERACVTAFTQPLLPEQTIVVYSSGSSGTPCANRKTLAALSRECHVQEALFGERVTGQPVVATVAPYHMYGLLFSVLWPLMSGRTIETCILHYPEQLDDVLRGDAAKCIVASPAQLSRLDSRRKTLSPCTIFSSAAALAQKDALALLTTYGVTPIEILGSSETGGIAWREQVAARTPWQALTGVDVSCDDEQGMWVRSPWIDNEGGCRSGDRIKIHEDGRFDLLGRVDSLVKCEGKRVSLQAIEQSVIGLDEIDEVRAILLKEHREKIALVVVPSERGWALLVSKGKVALNDLITAKLTTVVERVALPKRFRYLKTLPQNAQGKTLQAALPKVTLPHVTKIMAVSDEQVRLTLAIPVNCVYFQGHFTDTPLLPGLTQLCWAQHFAKLYLPQCGLPVSQIPQLKFSKVIKPGTECELELNQTAKGFRFAYWRGGKLLSKGSVNCEERA